MERHLGRNFRAIIWREGRCVVYDLWKGQTLVACGYAIEGDDAVGLERCREMMAECLPAQKRKAGAR